MQKTSISLQEIIPVLVNNGYNTVVLSSEKEVKDFINQTIPDQVVIGLGDSITTCKLNIRHILATKGSKIFYSWDGSDNYNRSLDTFEIPQRPEYFLTRINAITISGDILLKDFDKNAALKNNFPSHVLAFIGQNRIIEELENKVSIEKYPVIKQRPEGIEFTVALLPFIDY